MIKLKSIAYSLLNPIKLFLPKKVQFRLVGFKIFKFRNKIVYDNELKLFKVKNFPSIESLNQYYRHSYWEHFNVPALLDKRDVLHFHFFQNTILEKYWFGDIQQSNFLNYGGAFGGICFLASAKGMITTNVDFTKSDFSSNSFKTISPNVFYKDEDFENSVDFFYSSHSMEHVHDLNQFVVALQKVLKTGGIFFGEVPNAGSDKVEFLSMTGGGNGEIIVPHTYYFTENFFHSIPGFEVLTLIKYPSLIGMPEINSSSSDGDSLFFVLRKI